MKNSLYLTVIVLLSIGLSGGCTTTKLLSTEFDNFSVGAIPNPHSNPPTISIPGEPTNDFIYWTGPPNLGQTFPPFKIDGGNLQYVIDRSNAGNESLLGFLPANDSFDDGYFNFIWEMEFAPNIRRLLNIRLTSGDDYTTGIVLDLEVRPIVTTGGGSTSITYTVQIGDGQFIQDFPYRRLEQLGEITRSGTTFLISINIEQNEYLISFNNYDGTPEYKALPFGTTGLNRAPTLWFKFAETGEARGHLTLEKVKINHSITSER